MPDESAGKFGPYQVVAPIGEGPHAGQILDALEAAHRKGIAPLW